MQWRGASEILAGYVIKGRISPDVVDPNILEPPYDLAIRLLQDGAKEIDLVDPVGISAVTIAKNASEHAGGDPYAYVQICEIAASRVQASRSLRPIVERLERGEKVDVAKILSSVARLENGYREFTSADQVRPEKMIYVPSYYPPLDRYVGGYPKAGLTIVAGVTGTGKTTFLIELARRAARNHKTCAILTLEMTASQLLYRMLEVDPKLDKTQRKKILLSDDVYNVDEAYSAAARLAAQHELHFIGVDYADMLVGTKEQSEASMGRIYNSLSVLAKKTGVPVVLVAQYRRTDGKVPTIEDIRYSGRAEQAASMILLLYNQDMVFARSTMDDENNPLPHSPGCAWIVIGKTRYRGKQPSALGAIKVIWDASHGSWGVGAGRDSWEDLTGRI